MAFAGDYYNFSLLPAQWSPGRIDAADPPIFVSAVGPWMSKMAGEVCDGVHVHPLHSASLLSEVQLPRVAAGAEAAGRSLADITVEVPVMTAVGDTEEELEKTREHARLMVAFYGSTPGYGAVFEHHGFEGLSEKLSALQRQGDVGGMVAQITDDILDNYIVSASWDDMADALAGRYGGLAPSLRLMTYTANTQYADDPSVLDRWADVVAALAAR